MAGVCGRERILILHNSRAQALNHYTVGLCASLPFFPSYVPNIVPGFWGHIEGLEINNESSILSKLDWWINIGRQYSVVRPFIIFTMWGIEKSSDVM